MGAVVAFSGGCFSGKTTSMKAVQELLPNNTIISDEVIRSESLFDYMSIEDIRKNSRLYLDMQSKIIEKKIVQDRKLVDENPDKIVLLDRCLTDSLFYLTFYLDKSKLKFDEYEKLYSLICDIYQSIPTMNYTKVLHFTPIYGDCLDAKFRPRNINQMKHIEHKMIGLYNHAFFKENLVFIDLNLNEQFKVLELCRGLI